MFHAAVFAHAKSFARGLKLFFTHLGLFGRFKAFGGAFVGGGHGAVAADVFFKLFVSVVHGCKSSASHQSRDEQEFFH